MRDVGALESFEERSIRLITVGTREIGVIRWQGSEVYALHNRCPHMGGPLCSGTLGALREGTPGCISTEDIPVIACSWHHWEFDVSTGHSLYDDRYRAKTYAVEVRDGRVLVDIK